MWVNEGEGIHIMYHIEGKFGWQIKYGIWQISTNFLISMLFKCGVLYICETMMA